MQPPRPAGRRHRGRTPSTSRSPTAPTPSATRPRRLRSYLGDPAKQRVSTAAPRCSTSTTCTAAPSAGGASPTSADAAATQGLDKKPPLLPGPASGPTRSRMGPSETLRRRSTSAAAAAASRRRATSSYHCHVAHHYFAGMWGIWRVYNTPQDGPASTDGLPPLHAAARPARPVRPAVTVRRAGRHGRWAAGTSPVGDLAAWVEPPAAAAGRAPGLRRLGVRLGPRRATVYRNEPETDASVARATGPRRRAAGPPILFDPLTGQARLPVPAPPPRASARPSRPATARRRSSTRRHGRHRPASARGQRAREPLPGRARRQKSSTSTPSRARPAEREARHRRPRRRCSFALKEDLPAVRADPARRVPLAIRANAGRGLRRRPAHAASWSDNAEAHAFSKVNMHIHFVQFDVQASDGVVAGFNYEQSVRPYRIEGEALAAPAPRRRHQRPAGAAPTRVPARRRWSASGMDAGPHVRGAHGRGGQTAPLVTLGRAARAPPTAAGEIVSTEFVRYRWYPDTQFGTAYFHDHVNALGIVAPRPLRGAGRPSRPARPTTTPAPARSCAAAPSPTSTPTRPVSGRRRRQLPRAGVVRPGRQPAARVGRSTGSALNLRAEPLAERRGRPGAAPSAATAHGDPATPCSTPSWATRWWCAAW